MQLTLNFKRNVLTVKDRKPVKTIRGTLDSSLHGGDVIMNPVNSVFI
jgi:hypothetical protein